MLSKNIKIYLNNQEDTIKLPKKTVSKYIDILKVYNITNGAVIELMSQYLGEYYGKEGHIINLAQDLSSFDDSITCHLRKHDNVSEKYFSLFDTETDDYLLYNNEDDSVKLVEAENIKELSRDEYFDKKWDSFSEFLEWHFEL